MANVTGDGNYTSKMIETLSAPPAGMAELFTSLNIFLSITASLGNSLILVALQQVSSIHPPMKLFFRSLAVTDLCVGLIAEPLYATDIMSGIIKMNANVSNTVQTVARSLSLILCGVSVLTSTAISVDRLLALLLGLRNGHVVTLRRVRVVMISFWLISASVGLMGVYKREIAFRAVSFFVTLSLVISIYCYTRIYLNLRHRHAQVQNNVPQGQLNAGGIPVNIGRYKKTVSSIIWIQLVLVVCYVPFGIVGVLEGNEVKHYVALRATATLVYFNSSLNPFLYCWKIRKVRRAVKVTIKQLCCL